MEIQFSIPINGGRSNSSAPKRHVKCDETKPACLNCLKWRGSCDGYGDAAATPAESATEPRPRSTASRSKATSNSGAKPRAASKIKVTTGSTAVVKARPPTIPEEPSINTICFTSSEQRSYFDEWSALSVGFLSGGLGDSRLWTTTMPQLTLQEPSLRYAAMAVGALRKASNVEFEASSPGNELAGDNKHYLNAIVYYCEALQLQAKARPTKEGLRTAMLASLLFICFEAQRGNMPAALKHITHGFSMLNELAACTDKAPSLVRIAPAPPALVQEILDCYKPLELQSRSFMGSYKKFFFPPKPPAVAAKQAPASQMSSPHSVSSPPSQPGTPWASAPSSQQNPVGLPSPQSQASPQAMSDQQTPPRAPPQRPPGIAPFTKHSPYFRPKQTNISVIEDMPAVFSTLDEAHGYWTLLQRQLVQYIPLLTATTAQLALTKVRDMKELEVKLDSVRQNPRISKFLEESRHWLQRWSTSFSPLLQTAQDNRQNDEQSYLQAINFHIEFLILYIYTAMPRYSGVETAKDLTPQYRELNAIAETLIASRPNCGFAMDSGWTWPLFVSAFGCRDPEAKQDAIRILGKYPIRNALRDSRVFRAIALKNLEVEAMNAMEGDEDKQWLRLRRRELVFEDLGMNIIFRYAEKNQATGEWELIEEVAAFMVGEDGQLNWHRQPISESVSILSGVC
ncbi:Aspercryptin biosynthesis cluster-specific transcription regulator atnN [Fusarium oxysporum f. sp. conglutinans]|nr:Aspercryptin biosynthesis cluster-specific transcription regulator atnN [Fusarium oxysporum f. sp. conglutinans]